jgi:hypothetical protein
MFGMRTMIILATVAFGAMRLMLRLDRADLASEWTADE